MLRSAPLTAALFSFLALLAMPVLAEAPAAAPATPSATAPDAPKADAAKPTGEKATGKMRDRWKKMTPEQRDEMRKKAETRLGERYDRLKTAEQENIKTIMGEISKLNKEERSILMAKIRQQASKERQQRKTMKDMENKKSEAPAADPNATKH